MVFVNKLVLIIDCFFFMNGGIVLLLMEEILLLVWYVIFKCLRLERGILNKNMKEDFCECLFFYR